MTLLKTNSQAIALTLWNNETPWIWNKDKVDFLNDSGWMDTFSRDGKLVLDDDKLIGNLFFIEGKFHIKACLGSESVISYKFWRGFPSVLRKIPGAKLERSPVFRGYDLIFPIDVYITLVKNVVADMWTKFLTADKLKILEGSTPENIEQKAVQIGVLDFINSNPIIPVVIGQVNAMEKLGIPFTPIYVEQGDYKNIGLIIGEYYTTPDDIRINVISNQLLELSHNRELSRYLYSRLADQIPHPPNYPQKIKQYELSEAKGKDLELAKEIRSKIELYNSDSELIMALASQGLLSKMQDRKDYYTVFNENLDMFNGYLRYPIGFSGYSPDDIKIERTDKYQADYTNPMADRIMIKDSIFPYVQPYSNIVSTYESETYVGFVSRTDILLEKAVGKYLSNILGRYVEPQSQLQPSPDGIYRLEDGTRISLTQEQIDGYYKNRK